MEQVLIRFRLVGDEAQALRALSIQEMRRPRDQTRHILRQELERRGLLSTDTPPVEVKSAKPRAEQTQEVRHV